MQQKERSVETVKSRLEEDLQTKNDLKRSLKVVEEAEKIECHNSSFVYYSIQSLFFKK